MIKGQEQVVAYNTSANYLYHYVHDDDGLQGSASITYTVYSPSGTQLATGTISTAETATTEGWMKYDAQTAEFEVGERVTMDAAGTPAYGTIREQRKSGTAGQVYLVDVDGTPANNKTMTTPGGGSATTDGTLFVCLYKLTLDTTSTGSYPIDRNYWVKWAYTLNSVAYVRRTYFDVATYPATPWVTTTDIDEEYPALVGLVPDGWTDWTPAIKAAHREICNKLDSLGVQASHLVRREQEMWDLEVAFTRKAIAEKLGAPLEEIKHWEEKAASKWASRGEFTYDTDEDAAVDSENIVVSSGFTR